MNLTNLQEQLTNLYQSNPLIVYVLLGILLLLAIFKRKALIKLFIFLLFVGGVYLVVSQFGQSVETGIKNKESMAHKTEKALK